MPAQMTPTFRVSKQRRILLYAEYNSMHLEGADKNEKKEKKNEKR